MIWRINVTRTAQCAAGEKKMNKKIYLIRLLFCFFICNIHAAILPPPKLEPLMKDNFIYKCSSSQTKDYFFGTIIIESIGEIKYKYEIPIYAIKIKKNLEADVQWKFIKSMEFKNDEIITIVNAQNKVFEFNINTYEVECITEKTDPELNELYRKYLKKYTNHSKKNKYKGIQPEKKKLSKIEDVITVFESTIFSNYGEDKVKKGMPYIIFRYKDKWDVQSLVKLKSDTEGLYFFIVINSETSQIEFIDSF